MTRGSDARNKRRMQRTEQLDKRMSDHYNADCEAMAVAARAWKAAHPDATPAFTPFPLPASVPSGFPAIIAPLDAYVISKVAADEVTADLLRTLDAAAVHGRGASLLQAEAVVETVFGIPHFARKGRN